MINLTQVEQIHKILIDQFGDSLGSVLRQAVNAGCVNYSNKENLLI
jgi:hypothetical protein